MNGCNHHSSAQIIAHSSGTHITTLNSVAPPCPQWHPIEGVAAGHFHARPNSAYTAHNPSTRSACHSRQNFVTLIMICFCRTEMDEQAHRDCVCHRKKRE